MQRGPRPTRSQFRRGWHLAQGCSQRVELPLPANVRPALCECGIVPVRHEGQSPVVRAHRVGAPVHALVIKATETKEQLSVTLAELRRLPKTSVNIVPV